MSNFVKIYDQTTGDASGRSRCVAVSRDAPRGGLSTTESVCGANVTEGQSPSVVLNLR